MQASLLTGLRRGYIYCMLCMLLGTGLVSAIGTEGKIRVKMAEEYTNVPIVSGNLSMSCLDNPKDAQ